MSAPPASNPARSRSRASLKSETDPSLFLAVDDIIDEAAAAGLVPLLAYVALIRERERERQRFIAMLARVRSERERLRKSPPTYICYAAGATIAALHSFGWLMDEWSWYRSELRNWMIGNGFDDIVCKIAGQRIRVTLAATQLLVCVCHAREAIACETVMADAAAGRAIAVRAIDGHPRLTVKVVK